MVFFGLGHLPCEMHATTVFLVVTLGLQSSVAFVYDRAITVFSPDGKLIQVSYAEEAVQRGGLAVAASNGRNAIAICLERPPDDAQAGPDHSNNGAASEGTKHEDVLQQVESAADIEAGNDYTGGVGGEHRGRQRTRREASTVNEVVGSGILDDANNQDRKLCEVDEGVYLAFAGISADGRVLASKIRLECQNYRFGMGTPPGVGYIARYVGELQHKYTRTGGARPFGVSCVVAGFDEDACPRVFRSEPSGAFAEWTASAVGKGSDKALEKLEAVPELGALDWRGLAIEAVRATLASDDRECDVVVLRRETDATTGDGQMAKVATDRRWRRRGNAWMRRFSGSLAADGGVLLEGSGGQGSKHECDDAEVL